VLVQAGVCTLGERVSMLCSSKAFIFPGGTNEILNKLVFLCSSVPASRNHHGF